MTKIQLEVSLDELELITHWFWLAENEYGLDEEDHELWNKLDKIERDFQNAEGKPDR